MPGTDEPARKDCPDCVTGGSALRDLTSSGDAPLLAEATEHLAGPLVALPLFQGAAQQARASDGRSVTGPPSASTLHGCPVGIVLLLN